MITGLLRKEIKVEERNNEKYYIQDKKNLLKNNEGMGTVEIILIIVVLVGLVIIFKDQITDILSSLFSKVTTNIDKL